MSSHENEEREQPRTTEQREEKEREGNADEFYVAVHANLHQVVVASNPWQP